MSSPDLNEFCFMCWSSRAGTICPHGKRPLLLPKAEKAIDYEEKDGKTYCLTCVPDYEDKDIPCMHGMMTKYFLLPDSQQETQRDEIEDPEEEFGPEDACAGEDELPETQESCLWPEESYWGEEVFGLEEPPKIKQKK